MSARLCLGARCNRPIRTAAATLAGLAFGPVCAKRLDLLPQRSATRLSATQRAPSNPVRSMDRAIRKQAGAGSEPGQMALFDEVNA